MADWRTRSLPVVVPAPQRADAVVEFLPVTSIAREAHLPATDAPRRVAAVRLDLEQIETVAIELADELGATGLRNWLLELRIRVRPAEGEERGRVLRWTWRNAGGLGHWRET